MECEGIPAGHLKQTNLKASKLSSEFINLATNCATCKTILGTDKNAMEVNREKTNLRVTVELSEPLDGIVDPGYDVEPVVEAATRLRPTACVGEVEVDVSDVASDGTDASQITEGDEVLKR